MFASYLRIVSIDYLENSWVKCVVFLRKHPNFMTFDHLTKLKEKTSMVRKNLKKFGQIDKSILANKKVVTGFFVE